MTDDAVAADVANVEWAIERILADDFPMRPHQSKCEGCDFNALCPRGHEEFSTDTVPPPIRVPGSALEKFARAFSQVEKLDDGMTDNLTRQQRS